MLQPQLLPRRLRGLLSLAHKEGQLAGHAIEHLRSTGNVCLWQCVFAAMCVWANVFVANAWISAAYGLPFARTPGQLARSLG